MGLHFRKRVNLGGGFGLNISSRGVSSSLRTKYGTVGSKRISVNTGIKGVTYSKRLSKSNASGCVVVLLITFLIVASCRQIV